MDTDRNLAERTLARAAGTWEGARRTAARGWAGTKAAGDWLGRSPFGSLLRGLLAIASWWHARIWRRWAWREGRLVRWRAAAVIGLTALLLWMTPSFVGWTTRAILMAATIRTEQVKLTVSQEVDAQDDIHSIKGCSSFPCDNAQAVYYRVRGNFVHDIYALATRGEKFYAEEVASVVVPGVNDCTVVSYGLRIRALRRGWGVYPNILSATCTPSRDREAA